MISSQSTFKYKSTFILRISLNSRNVTLVVGDDEVGCLVTECQ